MISRYAVVDADLNVINVIALDDKDQFQPPEGTALLKHDDINIGDNCEITDGKLDFVDPPPVELSVKEKVEQGIWNVNVDAQKIDNAAIAEGIPEDQF